MQKASHPQDNWRYVVFFLIGLFIIVADQFSKTWIRANLLRGHSLFELGFFRIINVQNTGAAFGLFKDHLPILTIVSFIGVFVILLCVFLLPRHLPFLDTLSGKSALGLVLGGTVGNLIDRLRFGYVTDFIDFGFWPAFNVADSAVTVGVILFAYSLLSVARAERH